VHARIHASPARNRITTTGWIDDRRLLELYQTSSILAFPSLDEGFGIPVLEGMAHGLAVLASTRGALPEVCGDAALLVNPLQTDDITGALRDIIRNPDLKRHLEQKGILRAREFGWPKAVEKTWAVYQELIEGGP
jgi:glycosyltransferase involved in cell wall biosynthesis